MNYHHGRHIGQRLIDAGLCPKGANNIELHVPVNGAMFVRYDVLVDSADLAKVAKVLDDIAAEGSARLDARAPA